jgi:hypothetical protein
MQHCILGGGGAAIKGSCWGRMSRGDVRQQVRAGQGSAKSQTTQQWDLGFLAGGGAIYDESSC